MTLDDEEFLKTFDTQLDESAVEDEPEEILEQEEEVSEDTEPVEQEEDNTDTTEDEDEEEPDFDTEDYDESEDLVLDEEDEAVAEEEEPEESVDLQGFYNSIMKPFKANGKEIVIKKPDEAIQLMQMGANYTRKMQEISKHRKTLATLEQNGISSIDDITFLIDLKNKDPEAIKKFFKDNEIDPFDIDTSSEVNYKSNAKVVSEKDIDAKEILEELNSTTSGSETLKVIADTWDDESTQFMWNNPQTFNIIHEQRESGVFDKIMSEVERQTTLGILPHGGSILEKYHTVGNQLYGGQPQQDVNTRRPIDTRVASRSSAQRSNKRAKAASSPRASKRTSMVLDDLLNLDDDKFLEAMKNKL